MPSAPTQESVRDSFQTGLKPLSAMERVLVRRIGVGETRGVEDGREGVEEVGGEVGA
jgi:hypothetical protein